MSQTILPAFATTVSLDFYASSKVYREKKLKQLLCSHWQHYPSFPITYLFYNFFTTDLFQTNDIFDYNIIFLSNKIIAEIQISAILFLLCLFCFFSSNPQFFYKYTVCAIFCSLQNFTTFGTKAPYVNKMISELKKYRTFLIQPLQCRSQCQQSTVLLSTYMIVNNIQRKNTQIATLLYLATLKAFSLYNFIFNS